MQISRWLCAEGGGGIQTYLAGLARALPASVELRYAALMPGEAPPYAPDAWLGTAGAAKWRNAWALRRWLERELDRADLVHFHGVTDWHFVVGARACRRRGVPYVVTPHGALLPASLAETRRRRIKTWIYLSTLGRKMMLEAAAVVVSSELEARAVRALSEGMAIRVCPPGVDVPGDRRNRPPGTDHPDMLRVVFLGRVEPIKSLPTLLRAVAALRRRGIDAVLDVVGSGPSEHIAQLRQLGADLRTQDAVAWHGYLSGARKSAVLRDAHVVVLPSWSENFGFSVAESMAQGLPVIVSDGVGLADVVDRAGAGSVFPAGDHHALTAALREYVDIGTRRDRGARAHEAAREAFSLGATGSALARIYHEAIGTRDAERG